MPCHLLFCITLNPLSALLDKNDYRFKGGTTINHFLYISNIKLYAKNEQSIDSLIHLTRVFSFEIGMKFGLAKCECLIVNRDQGKKTRGIRLPESEIDDIDKSYKYFEILLSLENNEKKIRCKATYE